VNDFNRQVGIDNKDQNNASRPTWAVEAFYGRRKGPKLHKGQQCSLDELLPKLNIDLQTPPPDDLTALFKPVNVKQVQIEIGFGGGEHLLHQARENPDIGFIGVEPFVNGMAKLLSVIKSDSIQNIVVYDDDATRILDWLPAASLSRIYLLYPDPWPKKRHWKRRFVCQKNLERLARVLKPDGELRFATDIDAYQNWTLLHIYRYKSFEWTAGNAADWHKPWEEWITTRYEAKALREGRKPGYFRFKLR